VAFNSILFQDGLVSLTIPVGSMLWVAVRPLIDVLASLLGLPFEVMLSGLACFVAALFYEVSG
jgi:hypothetical protein